MPTDTPRANGTASKEAAADATPTSPSKGRTAELTFRTATDADLPDILDLMRLSLGENLTPRSRDFWQWKHIDNPFGASPVLLAVAEDGTLAGLRVFMRWTWRVGDRDVPAVRAVDTATHPDWRGQGIFTRLTLALVDEMQEEGVAFVFNTPNKFSRPGYLKMGWEYVGRPTLWLRPLRPLQMAGALLGARGEESGEDAEGDDDARPALPFPSAESVLASPGLEAMLNGLRLTDETHYATPRSVDYLRWRYAAIPGYRYYALLDREGDRGALVLFRTRERRGMREIALSEVLVTPDDEGRRRGRALLSSLADRADADYLVAMSLGTRAERRVLLGSGFVPLPKRSLHFTARPLHPHVDRPDPVQLTSWRVSLGDFEIL